MSLMAAYAEGESMEERTVIIHGLSEHTDFCSITSEMKKLDCCHILYGFCDGKTAAWFIFNSVAEALRVYEELDRKEMEGEMLRTQVRQLDFDNRLIVDDDGVLSKRIRVDVEREWTVLIRGVNEKTRLVDVLAKVLETHFIPQRLGFAKGGLISFVDFKTKEEAQLVARLLCQKSFKGDGKIDASAPA